MPRRWRAGVHAHAHAHAHEDVHEDEDEDVHEYEYEYGLGFAALGSHGLAVDPQDRAGYQDSQPMLGIAHADRVAGCEVRGKVAPWA